MEILIETYHDGHHEIVVGDKRYIVDERKEWNLHSESHALPVVCVQCECHEVKK
jgi:hypothetical protein